MPRAAHRAGPFACAAALALAACDAPDPTPQAGRAPQPPRSTTAPAPPAAAPVQDAAPPRDATADTRSLLDFLRGTYGPDARITQPWTDADGRERRVCARGGSPEADAWPSLLAVCADVPDCTGTGAGAIDVFALVRTRTGVRAEALAREVESGANGCAGGAAIVRFGRDRWGFLHSGGLTSQGYVFGWTKLRAFRAGRLEELATVNTTFDNVGAQCDADDCREVGISINADLRFAPGDGRDDAWDLVVHESGVECFLNVDRSRRYRFDAARFRYPVPDGPPDVACPPVANP
jgi:hypothetical protein